MPIFPLNRTFRSGFHNSKKVNGVHDRIYPAKDMRNPYKGIFSNGVKPNDDGTLSNQLFVEYVSGMQIKVNSGTGIFDAWFDNFSPYVIELDTAGVEDRYDCIIVRNDDTDTVRDTFITVKSLDHVPTIDDLERSDLIKEFLLGYVYVAGQTNSISQNVITDTRINQNLCGVITGVFNQLDGETIYAQWNENFNLWFDTIKDTFVANATLIHTYYNRSVSTAANQTRIPIGIPQYNKDTDILLVMVNGLAMTEKVNYTIYSNAYIDLAIGLPVVGTVVQFQVLKSVDGSEAQSVVTQVNTLINQMNDVNKKLEFDYYCNGENDNVLIGDIVRAYLNGGTDYGSVKLNVIGTLGMSIPAKGEGTSTNPYVWFNFEATSNRKIIVDFTQCGQISPSVISGAYNRIFNSGSFIHVIGANIVVGNTQVNTIVRIIETVGGIVKFDECRFYITSYQNSLIALHGTFTNCRGSVANLINNSYCFMPSSYGVVKIIGGEYYAYTGDSTVQSAVVGQSGADAVSILYGVSAPTSARTGYYQTNSLLQWAGGGVLCCTDLISELPMIVVAGISNIRGIIEKSKQNVW